MDSTLWLSIGLGVGLVALNIGASLIILKWAMPLPNKAFIKRVFGGMGIRLTVLVGAVVAVLLWLPVDPKIFAGALIAALAVGLFLEVALMKRQFQHMADAPNPNM